MAEPEEIVRLLRAHEEGDPGAFGRLVPLVYDQLRRLARYQRRQGPQARSLDTTALVHEAYLKLAGSPGLRIRDRGHLMAVTACAMRQVLIGRARARLRMKRGAGSDPLPLDEQRLTGLFARPLSCAVATHATARRAGAPRPILKWAGGKQAMAERLVEAFPVRFDRYFEPFVGGASVFLALQPRRAVLCDRNAWLVETYRAVRDHAAEVARELRGLRNTREEYLRIRAIGPGELPPARRAAHLVYLNKTCFRGLFRVNRAGRFNVPYGAYERRYFDPGNLERFAACLAGVDLRCGDFEHGLAGITARDFAYLDPPYHEVGGYSDFNRYTDRPFAEADHERLAATCRALDRRGVRWAVTQSDTAFVRGLFAGFRIRRIAARREINLASSRRDIVELLITNA